MSPSYLPCAMLQQKACYSFRAYHDGDAAEKNKAICMICNAQVKFYSNTTNLRKHLTSRIRRHDFRNEWMADGGTHCFVYYTHTKARTTFVVFSAAAVSLYDDMNTQISSPAALSDISLTFYRLISENYRHIIYTAAASSSRQPVKIKVRFNLKKLSEILLYSSLKTQCNNSATTTTNNNKY